MVEIKGATERKSFLPIWMVSVNERVFARSWNTSKRSWFTAFVETGVGQIRYGEKVIDVKGQKLARNRELTSRINQRYLEKYDQE